MNKQAPLKQKYIRANDEPFMSKNLRKAIMKRSRLKNRFNKNRTDENWLAYKTQRNLCVKILRENKKSYYAKIDTKAICDNKRFWKVVKPLFSNKVQTSSCITLLENNIVNSDEKEVAEILNDYFINITQTLGTSQENKGNPVKYQKQSSCEGIIKHFQSHPSILKLKASVPCTHMFSFKRVTVAEMKSQLQHLNIRKSSPQKEIPSKLLKLNIDLFCYPLIRLFNLYADANKFPDDLKLADVTALYKKDDRMNKTNYRPISLLPTISKIFERLIHIQLYDFIALKLSALLGGFRKNYNTQHVFLNFLQNCKNIIDKNGFAGAVFMDLSKAFDSMNHGLLIAKLHAYGLSIEALELIQNYLSNRKQRVKFNSTFSAWKEIKVGAPQESVLGPLLFNVFINDTCLFVNKTKICNYADDTTIYACHTDLNTIIKI